MNRFQSYMKYQLLKSQIRNLFLHIYGVSLVLYRLIEGIIPFFEIVALNFKNKS